MLTFLILKMFGSSDNITMKCSTKKFYRRLFQTLLSLPSLKASKVTSSPRYTRGKSKMAIRSSACFIYNYLQFCPDLINCVATI